MPKKKLSFFESLFDADFDGDHDFFDDMIISKMMEEDEKNEEWRNYCDEGYMFGVDQANYDTLEEFEAALEDAKYGWRRSCEDGSEYDLDPEDFETLEEYEQALEEAKYAWRDDCEDGSEYGVDPEDYETPEAYEEALEEAKYAWRDDCEDGSEYGVDPEDYETLEEYEESLEEAKIAWRDDCEDGSEYCVYPEDYDTLEKYEEALADVKEYSKAESENDEYAYNLNSDSEENDIDITTDNVVTDSLTKQIVTYSAVESRCRAANKELHDIRKGEAYGDEGDIKRYKFISANKTVASRYLTLYGQFLYASAVKDNFKLPFELEDEYDEVKTQLSEIIEDLSRLDSDLALEVWHWCITNFTPYMEHTLPDSYDTPYSILGYLGSFKKTFVQEIVKYMASHPDFTESVILYPDEDVLLASDLVVTAIELDLVETAEIIAKYVFENPIIKVKEKCEFISNCIDESTNYEEIEITEIFRDRIFTKVLEEKNARIKSRIADWQSIMNEHITEEEKYSERYAYSRRNAWRVKYRENDFGIDPTDFETEEELIAELNEMKYEWRRSCYGNRFGLNPDDYETYDEYNSVINKALDAERRQKQVKKKKALMENCVYSFCKVATDFPNKPFYYYLVGDLKLKVGDTVIVPFGKQNNEIEGVVVALGECYAEAFPCDVELIKTVLGKKP